MAHSRNGGRLSVSLTLLCSLVVVVVEGRPAEADVASVTGSAFGVLAKNVSIFGGALPDTGPFAPVSLPPTGSAAPITDTVPTSVVKYGPATFFSSGPIAVSTVGSLGATGSVTTTSTITNVNTSGQESFTATGLSSACTATAAGATGSTTITNGTLQTDNGDGTAGHPPVEVVVPTNPAPNTSYTGHIHVNNAVDNFRYVFNEQTVNPDGSITVNAAHEYLLGPTALGDLFIGQSVCGASASGAPATTTTTAPAPATTTTTAPPAATTTTTTKASGGGVAGGAYGYYTSVGLFGGAPAARGPAPTVTLPAQGSPTPLTASDPSGSAQFGPATIFEAGKLDVSTEGTTSPRSVKSSATVVKPGPPPFSADLLTSSCTADASGAKGSTTITNGKVDTKTDADSNPVATTQVPTNPAPNTEIRGTLEAVGDSFKWVFNEQIVTADGSITVNAAHEYLLGPVAKGDLVIGQSRCGTTAAAFVNVSSTGQTGTSGSSTAAAEVARTGSTTAGLGALGMVLVTWGLLAMVLGGQLVLTGEGPLSLPSRRRRRLRRS